MKDLSFIDKHVAKMKLSHEAIIRQWIRSGKVDLRDLVANVSDIRENVVFLPITRENLPQIKSGMFWYGDDTVSEKLSFTKKLKSLVLLADGDEILGDSFKEETLSWKKSRGIC